MQSKAFEDMSEKEFSYPGRIDGFGTWKIITPFIRPWLTMTKIESIPCTLGRSMTRSTESCLKGRVDVEAIGFSGGRTG